MMLRARTVGGAYVSLSDERLGVILNKHPELRGCEAMIIETVEEPDIVVQGHGEELLAMRFYEVTPVGPKHLVVVYREDKGIIITAFFISKADRLIRRRRVVWRRR